MRMCLCIYGATHALHIVSIIDEHELSRGVPENDCRGHNAYFKASESRYISAREIIVVVNLRIKPVCSYIPVPNHEALTKVVTAGDIDRPQMSIPKSLLLLSACARSAENAKGGK